MEANLSVYSTVCLFSLAAGVGYQARAETSDSISPTTESTIEAAKDEHEGAHALLDEHPFRPGEMVADALDSETFILSGLVIRGLQAFTLEQLLPLYQAMLGNAVSPETLARLAGTIEAYYRDKGYPQARVVIPRQNIRSGIVYVTVFEGSISRIRLVGESEELKNTLTPYLEQIPLNQPVDPEHLEHLTRVLNGLPGVSARPSVELISGTSNQFELLIYIRRRANSGLLSADNRGSKLLGPLRVRATYTLNNPFNTLSQIRFSHTSAPTHSELQYSTIAIRSALGARGLELDTSGAYGDVEPGDFLKDLTPFIRIKQLQSRIHYPLSLGYHHGLSAYAGVRYYEADIDILGARTLGDKLYTLRSGISYWDRIPELYANALKVDVVHGLQGLNDTVSINGEGLASSRAQEQFTLLRVNTQHTRSLTDVWQLKFELDAQYASRSLPAAELFSFGGAHLGRAYDPGEIFGDHGIAGQVSLQKKGLTVPFVKADAKIYGFYDIGKVWNKNGNHKGSAASAGIGSKITRGKFDISFEINQPLTRPVFLEEHGKNPRLFGKIGYSF